MNPRVVVGSEWKGKRNAALINEDDRGQNLTKAWSRSLQQHVAARITASLSPSWTGGYNFEILPGFYSAY